MGWPDLRAACDVSWAITEFAGWGLVGGLHLASMDGPAALGLPGPRVGSLVIQTIVPSEPQLSPDAARPPVTGQNPLCRV